jgi:hypothetical protein
MTLTFPMPINAPSLLLLTALTAVLHAGVPQKQALATYSSLWMNSPFTSKPIVAGSAAIANPLEDYALLGVSPIGKNGYRVTLINKKKPEDRVIVESGKTSADGFSIVDVKRTAGNPLATTVDMTSGTLRGVVKFDENLLTIAAPPPTAPVPAQGNAPVPQVQSQAPGQVIQAQPRPRVVPPPAPGQPNAVPSQIPGQRPSGPFGRRR